MSTLDQSFASFGTGKRECNISSFRTICCYLPNGSLFLFGRGHVNGTLAYPYELTKPSILTQFQYQLNVSMKYYKSKNNLVESKCK